MQNVWLNPSLKNSKPKTVIFADRDGTLIRHVDYVSQPEHVELLPGVKKAIHLLIELKIPLCIQTNQSGVGRGYFPIENVYACHERFFELLEIQATDIAGWCIAPEPPGSIGGYRKPSPRFIDQACQHFDTTPAQCHMIGDTLVDLETAWNAKASAWAVNCGKPALPDKIAKGEVSGKFTVVEDFARAVRNICRLS
ncbi:MAG: HAD-IIIA family hydrolase [Opitutaceae bacterium]